MLAVNAQFIHAKDVFSVDTCTESTCIQHIYAHIHTHTHIHSWHKDHTETMRKLTQTLTTIPMVLSCSLLWPSRMEVHWAHTQIYTQPLHRKEWDTNLMRRWGRHTDHGQTSITTSQLFSWNIFIPLPLCSPNPSLFLPLFPPLIGPVRSKNALPLPPIPCPTSWQHLKCDPENCSQRLVVMGFMPGESPGAALGRAQIWCLFLGVCSLRSCLLLCAVLLWACGDGPLKSLSIQGRELFGLSFPHYCLSVLHCGPANKLLLHITQSTIKLQKSTRCKKEFENDIKFVLC